MDIRDARQKDWFWLDKEYLDRYAHKLGVSCTVVYVSLCRYADNKTQQCNPGIRLIAKANGISARTVITAIGKLEDAGIIKVVREKGDDGKHLTNIYTLLAKSNWGAEPGANNDQVQPEHHPHQVQITTKNQVKLGKRNNTYRYNNTNSGKEGAAGAAPGVIVSLIDLFKDLNPVYQDWYKNTTQRGALSWLVEKYGEEKVRGMISALPDITSRPYAPKITTPAELRRDLGKLLAFVKQEGVKTKSKAKVAFS